MPIDLSEYVLDDEDEATLLDPTELLRRDVRQTAALLDRTSAGFLVSMYYRQQKQRIQLNNQAKSLARAGKSTAVIDHFFAQAVKLENQIKSVLGVWAAQTEEGEWAQGVYGVGPVLSAACSAFFDIDQAPTVGHTWAFAGLMPPRERTWDKGEKRPWSAEAKTCMWKMGRCFVRLKNHPKAFYGHLYSDRKAFEIANNEAGKNVEEAERVLTERAFKDPHVKACYAGTANCAHDAAIGSDGKKTPLPRPAIGIGHLPPGRIDLRASRPAVKLFLAHWHTVAFERVHRGHADGNPEWADCMCKGTGKPPLPYPIAVVPGAPGAPVCGPRRKRVFFAVEDAQAAIRDPEAMHAYACTEEGMDPRNAHYHIAQTLAAHHEGTA